MKPIDGEKLIKEINHQKNVIERQYGIGYDQYRGGAIAYLNVILSLVNMDEFNLPPGTIIIQREAGFDKRDCYECIAWDDEFNSYKPYDERCSYAGDREKINCHYVNINDTQECRTCPHVKPCKYHVTESELKNAIIIGGDEK